MGYVKSPLHSVFLLSDLVSGFVRVAVCSKLPVPGISFILGNDLAGGKVFPAPEVIVNPFQVEQTDQVGCEFPAVFPACVVTCSSTQI